MGKELELLRLNLDNDVQGFGLEVHLLAQGAKASEDALLKQAFGEYLSAVLSIDPDPVVVKARHLLDEGPLIDGAPSWYFGKEKYGLLVTTQVFEQEFLSAFSRSPMYPGHQEDDYEPELGHNVWFGLEGGIPTSLIWVGDPAEKERVRRAAAIDALAKTYAVSMAAMFKVDKKSKRIIGIHKKDRASIDLVRWQGTERAAIEEPLTLNDNPKQGDRKMDPITISVAKLDDLFEHELIKVALGRELERRIALPETRKGVLSSASLVELTDANATVKELSARQTRDEVLASLSEKDLPVLEKQYLGDAKIRSLLAGRLSEYNEKVKTFREEKARPLVLAALGEEQGKIHLLSMDLSHMDESRVKDQVAVIQANLGLEHGEGHKSPSIAPEVNLDGVQRSTSSGQATLVAKLNK